MIDLKRAKGFLRLLVAWRAGVRVDGPLWGYLSAARWHLMPIINRLRPYLSLEPLNDPIEIRIRGCEHPIWLRPETSDYWAYRQIFLEREYAHIEPLHDARLVLDCGSNIGLASIYFLNHFAAAKVIAVEPDPENAALCRRNLQHYGARATVIEGAIWSHNTDLAVVPSSVGGSGNKWGISVRPRLP